MTGKAHHIRIFYPNFFEGKLIAMVCLQLGRHMQSESTYVDVMGSASHMPDRPDYYFDAIPSWLKGAAYRFLSEERILSISEWRFLNRIQPGDIAYIFPGVRLTLYQKLKKKGCITVTENINTHQAVSKRILDSEFKRLNLPATHKITQKEVEYENAVIELSDFFFSPSPLVTKSLINAGADENQVLTASYGLTPEEILPPKENGIREKSTVHFLFAGTICLRKGMHLLIDAWKKAGVAAKLTLVGHISSEIRKFLDPFLKRPEVTHIPFVNDLKPIYQDADVFVLPSIEEGSPLVIYLALGASLPCIVSPMGSGGITEDSKDGFIIDPHDTDKWAKALKKITEDENLRERMSIESGKKANHYLWEKVAAGRRDLLLSAIKNAYNR